MIVCELQRIVKEVVLAYLNAVSLRLHAPRKEYQPFFIPRYPGKLGALWNRVNRDAKPFEVIRSMWLNYVSPLQIQYHYHYLPAVSTVVSTIMPIPNVVVDGSSHRYSKNTLKPVSSEVPGPEHQLSLRQHVFMFQILFLHFTALASRNINHFRWNPRPCQHKNLTYGLLSHWGRKQTLCKELVSWGKLYFFYIMEFCNAYM
jgi:hypothetical protein